MSIENILDLTGVYWRLGRQALTERPTLLTRLALISHFGPWLRSMTVSQGPIADAQPWITFPAMRFLRRLMSPCSKVFEYGTEGSTLLFAGRVAEPVTVEHDADWLAKTAAHVPARPNFVWRSHLEPPVVADGPNGVAVGIDHYRSSDTAYSGMSFERYAQSIERYDQGYFDLVHIDGRARVGCFRHCLDHVRSGGYIALDNAEREQYRDAEAMARDLGHRVLEFWGPGPYNQYFWRTIFVELR